MTSPCLHLGPWAALSRAKSSCSNPAGRLVCGCACGVVVEVAWGEARDWMRDNLIAYLDLTRAVRNDQPPATRLDTEEGAVSVSLAEDDGPEPNRSFPSCKALPDRKATLRRETRGREASSTGCGRTVGAGVVGKVVPVTPGNRQLRPRGEESAPGVRQLAPSGKGHDSLRRLVQRLRPIR